VPLSILLTIHRCLIDGAKFSKKFFHTVGEGGKNKRGSDIGERAEDEKPFGYSRVGQGELTGRDDNILAIKQVKVDNARAVWRSRGAAAKGLFDGLKLPENFFRLFPDAHFENGVQEKRGTRGALNGGRFVNSRAEHRVRSGVEKLDLPAGSLEVGETRFDV
jgi:hypothetical protein